MSVFPHLDMQFFAAFGAIETGWNTDTFDAEHLVSGLIQFGFERIVKLFEKPVGFQFG